MDYLKINYHKLLHLKIHRGILFDLLLILAISLILIYAFTHSITKKMDCYGVYDGLVLQIVASEALSEAISKSHTLVFNDTKFNYEVDEYGEYQIVDDVIYQQIDIAIDKELPPNEVGKVTIYYEKEKIITFILKLFK